MRRLLAVTALSACANPISNQSLYDDAEFLAALPAAESLAAPREVRLARVGTNGLLAHGVGAAADLDSLMTPIALSFEGLRLATPAVRTDTVRGWEPQAVELDVDGVPTTWFVRGEVLRPVGATDLSWSVELSEDGDDPWLPVGSGETEPGGLASFAWQLAEHAALLGVDDPGLPAILDVLATPAIDGERSREILVEEREVLGLPLLFAGVDETVLTWFGEVAITEDGLSWPAATQLFHDPEAGGRALGARLTEGGEVPFEVCWNAEGDTVFAGGDGLAEVGEVGDCTVDPF